MSTPAGSHDPHRLHVYDCVCVGVCVQCQPDLLTQVTPSMSLDWHGFGRINDDGHSFRAAEPRQLLLKFISFRISILAQMDALGLDLPPQSAFISPQFL